tara:strand:- start:12219 stop:12422 length:204 start_codon:yes stop_codon:yes gene_type:complete
MEDLLFIKNININEEWKKTLLSKLGKKKPSKEWIQQLVRIYNNKYKGNIYTYNHLSNKIDKIIYLRF